ncbi:hypothetical protein QWY87_01940 [Lutimonas halocynthiae]|uniref:hypothetical protein n=1 Tax=Lutimonas halocynthiae TaxID=1446477 RepID=UPI0025B45BA5|nr:hypothetical protein [Lutimonas halocynthiae]MDN3641445.1 hypothetical protein [Lutimonas halocynthiae]
MKQQSEHGIMELKTTDLANIKGGHPVLVVLGVITTGVSLGRALDQAGQWFLEGWNNPR